MKKIISISLTFLILAALIHFSVGIHYCGGTFSAEKISLSGKLASCGMESDDNVLPLPGTNFTTHCCDNLLVYFGINGSYFPSFSDIPELFLKQFEIFNSPAGFTLLAPVSLNSIYTGIGPPETSVSSSVDLSNICVLRI